MPELCFTSIRTAIWRSNVDCGVRQNQLLDHPDLVLDLPAFQMAERMGFRQAFGLRKKGIIGGFQICQFWRSWFCYFSSSCCHVAPDRGTFQSVLPALLNHRSEMAIFHDALISPELQLFRRPTL